MSYIVTNCFQWVGFHIVNHLVDQGHNVIGFDDISSDKKENLSMFLGRNDLFSLNPNKLHDKLAYAATILVDDCRLKQPVESDRTIRLSYETTRNEIESNVTTIKFPLLFGEWMEMNENGMYVNGDFIRFDSELFLTESIYIKDFINCMLQSLKSAYLPSSIEIKASGYKELDNDKIEKSIYIRDNKPIQENLKIVLAHYKKFKNLY